MRRRIGLLFGSFNPVHKGHLQIAEAGLTKANCNQVWFMLQVHNHYKVQTKLASIEDRCLMLRAAIADNPKFKLGITRAKSMISAVEKLQNHYTDTDFVILMGQDLVDSLPKWKDYKKIINKFHIYSYQRVREAKHDISSQRVRDSLNNKTLLKELVPKPVAEYLTKHKIY